MNSLKRFMKEEDGATAIEYGLIAAIVSVAMLAALGPLGESLAGLFGELQGAVDDGVTASQEASGTGGGGNSNEENP